MKKLAKNFPFHYGWVIAILAFCMIVCTGLLGSGMSICLSGVRSEFGFDGTQTSLIPTIRGFAAFLIVLIMDKWYGKLGMRVGMAAGLFCGAIGFILMGIAKSNLYIYYAGAIVGGICYGLCLMTAATLIIKPWFNKNRATALGICSAGTGVTSFVFSTLLQNIINVKGVGSAFLFSAIVFSVVAVLILFLVINTPEEAGLEPVGGYDYVAEKKSGNDTVKAEHKIFASKGDIWFYCICLVLLGLAASPISGQQALALNWAGLDPNVVAAAASLSGLLMMFSKPCYGFISDHLGKKITCAVFCAIVAIGYLCVVTCAWAPANWCAYATFIGQGIGGAACSLSYPVFVGEWSSKEDFSPNFKKFQSAYMFGTLIGSPLPGIVCDLTGSYCWYWIVGALGYVAIAIGAFVIYGKLKKARAVAGEVINDIG